MRAFLILGLLAVLAGCKAEPTVTSTFVAGREVVQKLMGDAASLEAKLASAPTGSSGPQLAAAHLDSGGNTLVIPEEDFALVRGEAPGRALGHANRLGPTLNMLMGQLIYWEGTLKPNVRLPASEDRDPGMLESAQAGLRLAAKIRYLAVARPASVVDYDENNLGQPASWSGNLVVWDRQKPGWLGRVAVEVHGQPPKLAKAAARRQDGTLGTATLAPGVTVSDARGELNAVIDAAIHEALASGADVNQHP